MLYLVIARERNRNMTSVPSAPLYALTAHIRPVRTSAQVLGSVAQLFCAVWYTALGTPPPPSVNSAFKADHWKPCSVQATRLHIAVELTKLWVQCVNSSESTGGISNSGACGFLAFMRLSGVASHRSTAHLVAGRALTWQAKDLDTYGTSGLQSQVELLLMEAGAVECAWMAWVAYMVATKSLKGLYKFTVQMFVDSLQQSVTAVNAFDERVMANMPNFATLEHLQRKQACTRYVLDEDGLGTSLRLPWDIDDGSNDDDGGGKGGDCA